jgi:hypothetical protein
MVVAARVRGRAVHRPTTPASAADVLLAMVCALAPTPAGDASLQQPPAALLAELADDPADDPFAGARIAGNPAAAGSYMLRHKQHAQQHGAGSSGDGEAAFLHHEQRHHRQHITRSNGTHHWVWSSRLQLELPQPWDGLNMTQVVR